MKGKVLLLVAVFGSLLGYAQTFDHTVAYNVSISDPLYNYQPRVIADNAGDYFYTLSERSYYGNTVVTKFDANGNVLWAKEIVMNNSQNQAVYSSFCLSYDETELVLVGTGFYSNGSDHQILITKMDVSGGGVTASIRIDANDYVEGVGIRRYDNTYVIGGNYRTCLAGCYRMLLVHVDNSLSVIWEGYFDKTSSPTNDWFRDMSIDGDDVTFMGFNVNTYVELTFFHFNLSSHSLVPLSGSNNARSIIYRDIIEMPPHFVYEKDADGSYYYIGAGITDNGQIKVMLTQADYSFVGLWAMQYNEPNVNPDMWSVGRLLTPNSELVSAIRSNYSLIDGVMVVDKSTGAFSTSYSYTNLALPFIYPAALNTGSLSIVKNEYTNTRIMDGDGYAYNANGCGLTTNTLDDEELVITDELYEFDDVSFATAYTEDLHLEDVNGDLLDCNGTNIGTFKKETTVTGVEEIKGVNTIFPNPTTGSIRIQSENGIDHVVILDQLGREVLKQKCTTSTVDLDISGMDDGVYFIKVETELKTEIYRINKL